MKSVRILLTGFVLLTAAGLAAAQKVNVDWDKSADFTSFKTYAWGKGTPAKDPLMDKRVVQAVESQLAAKGLQKVEPSAKPDVVVLYHAAVDVETQLNTTDMGGYYGPGSWRWGMGTGMSTTTVDKIPVGHLIVDIGSLQSKQLVWRGRASDTLSDDPEKNEKKINKAAEKMFKKFPPPPENN